MQQQYIRWTCLQCGFHNKWEMHKPNACYVSMICENCGNEIEECLCQFQQAKSLLGRLGGQRTKTKYGKAHYVRIGKLGGKAGKGGKKPRKK